MVNGMERLKIVEAEKISGNVLVHFSNNVSILYHAQFLWDVREHDGNVAVSNEPSEEDDSGL